MLILAIDLGTTGNRAILFDNATTVVASAYREFTQIYPQAGWVEHDPEEIWESTREVILEVLSSVDPGEVKAVGITNQRETVVSWDPTTGKPHHNAIVWQDRRTAERCEKLKAANADDDIRAKTGLPCDPYFSATKIEWLQQHVPESRNGFFGTVDSWIIWKLTGGKRFVTDVSNASRTLLFNLKERRWDQSLLQQFGVQEKQLPEVLPSSGPFGTIDPSHFKLPLPITGVAGDQQASMFAQGCFSPGVVKNTYGTGLFMMQNTGESPHFSEKLVATAAWEISGKTEYALEGSVFVGGAAIQWLRDELRIIDSSKETADLASSLKSNDDIFFVPALTGLGAPHWDSAARGLLIGMTRSTSRAHLARAALESMAYQTRDVADEMARDLDAPLEVLQVDGGASTNDWLMQFQADILGVPIERPVVVETTAMGAAALAGLECGFWTSREEFVSKRKIEKRFEPQMARDEADRLHSRWQAAVVKSRAWAD